MNWESGDTSAKKALHQRAFETRVAKVRVSFLALLALSLLDAPFCGVHPRC